MLRVWIVLAAAIFITIVNFAYLSDSARSWNDPSHSAYRGGSSGHK